MSDETLQFAVLQWLQRKESKFYQTGVRDVFESWQVGNMETVLEIETYPVITAVYVPFPTEGNIDGLQCG
jgi:hypothetical protein